MSPILLDNAGFQGTPRSQIPPVSQAFLPPDERRHDHALQESATIASSSPRLLSSDCAVFTRFRILLPRCHHDAMLAQARAELPCECCGILAGRFRRDGAARVTRRYPLMNELASPLEYLSEPRSLFAAHKDMRARGLEVIATYHSHPSSAAIPSRTDRARRWSEEVVHFIVSLAGPVAELRGWWLTADDATEAAWELHGNCHPKRRLKPTPGLP